MKVTRSSILNLLLVAALLATLPSAIVRLWQSGNPYLLTADFFQDLLARLTGPGRLRFVLQPLTAIYLGVRSGAKDARSGRSAFLWALLFHAEHRKEMWLEAIASTRDLIALAILLDLVAQALIFHEIRPGPALIIGPPLILVPYALSRALTNRIAQRRAVHAAWHAH
ncbi:MAG TPA: hypothetical protein VE825_04490 [Terriglobales bacterium]|jgi:hypothetical protein|nr:hypothetical protein [Terriglobales bacterium]